VKPATFTRIIDAVERVQKARRGEFVHPKDVELHCPDIKDVGRAMRYLRMEGKLISVDGRYGVPRLRMARSLGRYW
jgi:hypothetical protein